MKMQQTRLKNDHGVRPEIAARCLLAMAMKMTKSTYGFYVRGCGYFLFWDDGETYYDVYALSRDETDSWEARKVFQALDAMASICRLNDFEDGDVLVDYCYYGM